MSLTGLGLPDWVLRDARNPGFVDPFDPYHDVTLVNYWNIFQGKLDWYIWTYYDIELNVLTSL